MFYENVRDLCSLHRTTITQLAKDLGISTSMPTKWKNGSVPKSDTLKMIADHFGVSTDQLLAKPSQSNTIGNVSGSAILQGNTSKNINVNGSPENGALSNEERELIELYRSLDFRSRIEFVRYGFELSDQTKGGE